MVLQQPARRSEPSHPGPRPPFAPASGFMAGDRTALGLMTAWLRRAGYQTRRVGLGPALNVGLRRGQTSPGARSAGGPGRPALGPAGVVGQSSRRQPGPRAGRPAARAGRRD